MHCHDHAKSVHKPGKFKTTPYRSVFQMVQIWCPPHLRGVSSHIICRQSQEKKIREVSCPHLQMTKDNVLEKKTLFCEVGVRCLGGEGWLSLALLADNYSRSVCAGDPDFGVHCR